MDAVTATMPVVLEKDIPGSVSKKLGFHRNTVSKAYQALETHGGIQRTYEGEVGGNQHLRIAIQPDFLREDFAIEDKKERVRLVPAEEAPQQQEEEAPAAIAQTQCSCCGSNELYVVCRLCEHLEPLSDPMDAEDLQHPHSHFNFDFRMVTQYIRQGYRCEEPIVSDPPRMLHHDEMSMKYLHKYDKNSAYLRACVNEMFGYGTPVHVEGAVEFDKRAPGVWRVRVKEPMLQDLPPVMWDKAQWVATPIVKLLKDTGHTIKIYEGWVFKEYHGTLKKWAEMLWEQRQDFRNNIEVWKHPLCREYARSATKDIAVATIGLSSFNFAEKTFKARPDWRTQVVAGTRATMFYNMLKVQKETGHTPIMVYLDALYYLSDEPDPAKALPLLDKPNSLGGYKNDGWSLEVDQSVLAILTSNDPSNQRLQKLNALVKEHIHAGK